MLIRIIAALIIIAATFISNRFFIHMFQLNSYQTGTQLKWYNLNLRKIAGEVIILLLAELATFVNGVTAWNIPLLKGNKGMLVIALLTLLFSLTHIEKYVKKKLVYTMRVIRLHVTIYIIVVLVLLYTILTDNTAYACLFSGMIYALMPLIILIANLLNRPLEFLVKRYYINDAKKMLNSNENLIKIGITGSFGKTSVKYFLSTILKAKYNTLMTPESYNTPMGITITIRSKLKNITEVFVAEMGAKRVGEIKADTDIVRPTCGIITSIGPMHLESFLSMDNIKKTKFELADSLPKRAILCINGDDDNIISYINENKEKYNDKTYNLITYGITNNVDYQAYDIKVNDRGTCFKMKIKGSDEGDDITFRTDLIGAHNCINIAGAIALAHNLGMSLKEIRPQVSKLEAAPHRLALSKSNDVITIDDAYNSNPSGAKAALDALNLFEGTKILITPGMVELGEKEDELNKEFGKQSAAVCDYVLLVGVNKTKPIYEGAIQAGMHEERVKAFDTIQEALSFMYTIESFGEKKIVLLENDLPDNY